MPLKPVDAPIKVILGPLIDDTDFKTREEAVAYNAAGMEIDVIMEKADGTVTTTVVTPTTSGNYDWAHTNQGYYELELPPTGGAHYNNREEGVLTAVGYVTGVLPFRSVAYDIVPAPVYASLVAGSDKLQVDAVEIDSTAQRATDLAEIAQYLFANTATLTAIIADNSVIAQMLATGGDISDYSTTDDTQESIRDAITAAAPLAYHPDSLSTINTGNQDANTYADCAADNGTRWTIGDENGDGGAGGSATSDYTIDVICEFNMGANRVATEVDVNGYFNRSGGGGYVVEVWAYNYTTAAWEKISSGSATEEMQDAASDRDYTWALAVHHTDPNTVPGEVKINFRSTRATTAGGDVLYLDHVQVDGVTSGSTSLEAFASAVWEHVIDSTAHGMSAGHHLHTLQALITTVATGDTTTSFTLTDGVAVNDAYNGMAIVVQDDTDKHYEARRIEDYTSGLVVTVDRAFGFTPASGDEVDIMATGYTEVRRGTDSGATAAKLLAYFQLAMRSDAAINADNATELTEVNADGGSGGGDFDNQTDAVEALRDRGDAAWTTRAGGDATEAKQDLILEDIVDVKGTDFVKDEHSLVNVIPKEPVNVSLTGHDITLGDS